MIIIKAFARQYGVLPKLNFQTECVYSLRAGFHLNITQTCTIQLTLNSTFYPPGGFRGFRAQIYWFSCLYKILQLPKAKKTKGLAKLEVLGNM